MNSPHIGATEALARFAIETRAGDIPTAALAAAHASMIDGFGVMLAGLSEPSAKIVHDYVHALGGRGEAVPAGSSTALPAQAAALANGVAGHAHDFDDTQISASPDRIYGLLTHPTPSALGAAYAAAQANGSSGEAMLAAYAVGLEVSCRICDAIDPFHYVRGFHTTGTIGIFGATAAAARLFGLDVAQMRNAFGIAASMSAGIRTAFGTMTKPLHPGRAAENGIVAARLALAGFDGREDVFENPHGFMRTIGADFTMRSEAIVDDKLWGYGRVEEPGCDPGRLVPSPDRPWLIVSPGLSIKPYPSVVLSHPSMDAMLALVSEHDVRPDEVSTIEIHGGPNVLNIKYHQPVTGTEGKFSMEFCLALMILRRRAVLADFTDEFVSSREAQEMLRRVKPFRDRQVEAAGFANLDSRIVLRLKDGRALERKSGPYKGSPANPLTPAELGDKFIGCAADIIGAARAAEALVALRAIREVADTRDLAPLLARAAWTRRPGAAGEPQKENPETRGLH